MKKDPESTKFTVAKGDVQDRFRKTKGILLRVSVRDHRAIANAAQSLHLTLTEYLVKCHEAVAEHIEKR